MRRDMKGKHLQHIETAPLISLAFFVVSLSLIFAFTTPERIVEYIGIENGYALLFAIAFFAGVSTFTSVPYQIVLVAFAASGLNPLLLGFVAATGIALGDTVSYTLGHFGRALVPEKGAWIQAKLQRIGEKHPRLLPLLFFSWGAFMPISNDVVTIPFGIARYPFLKLAIPLWLGTIIHSSMLAFFGEHIFTSLRAFFS